MILYSCSRNYLKYQKNTLLKISLKKILINAKIIESWKFSNTIGKKNDRASADPVINKFQDSSEIIFLYSSSGKAGSVSVLTDP
jgi:hypothetical protein